ncbi:MAG: hypothetical protein IKD68_10940, partial [Solobacterium sp.]|nr:hypothetical protein [Solobacterium sp.]
RYQFIEPISATFRIVFCGVVQEKIRLLSGSFRRTNIAHMLRYVGFILTNNYVIRHMVCQVIAQKPASEKLKSFFRFSVL